MSNNFCTMPFNSLEISPDGTCKVCCKIRTDIKKTDSEYFNVLTDSIEDIWNSKDLKRLRKKFLNNERPSECELCWTEEESNVKSLRLQTIKNKVSYKSPVISYLSLKLSNKCNLACRICSPHLSSLWQTQFEKLNLKLSPKKMFETVQMEKFQGERLDSLHKLSTNLNHLLIYGGEPLINDEVINYLSFLVSSGLSKNIQLTMNTNGTIYDKSQIELFNNFRKVDLYLSIDDIEKRFEYQRWPTRWSKINDNILNYSKHENFNLEFYPTVSVLNVLNLDEILTKLTEYNIPITFNNFVHDPKYLSIKNLPDSVKKQIIEILKGIDFTKFKFNKSYPNPKQALINFIKLKHDDGFDLTVQDYGTLLNKNMKIFDDFRKTDMKDYLPDFYRMIYEN